ncbi:MAG: RNA methyltransferase [Planctomycetes bacterium]|nr:RNA methyltransferase [Planctomycetota bacterium]
MPLIPINDVEDERLAGYRELLSAKASRRSGLFVVEGQLLVERLVESSFAAHSVLVDERRIGLLPEQTDDPLIYAAPAQLIENLVGYNFHRGILACGQRKPQPSLSDIMPQLPSPATIMICVGIQDPTNLGSILRSAAAFGVNAVLLGCASSDPFSRRVLRVSMGAALTLPLIESSHLTDDLNCLRDDFQFERVATVLGNAEPLERAHRSDRIAILIGNEAHGLPAEIAEACERRVTIPMQLGTDSLNAGVASGIMLHHFTRVASSTRS